MTHLYVKCCKENIFFLVFCPKKDSHNRLKMSFSAKLNCCPKIRYFKGNLEQPQKKKK